jgi:hypothetical protein
MGLLAGALFVLALTSHGPVPAIQIARFQGVVHPRRTPHHDATTRLPASARRAHEHHHVATGPRPDDPRSSGTRVASVSSDGRGRWSARGWASNHARRPQRLLTVYHDANAPPSGTPLASGRHA